MGNNSHLPALLIAGSIQGGVLAVIVFLLTRYLRLLSPTSKTWLWRLVFLRFALAFLPLEPVALPVLPRPVNTAAAAVLTARPASPAPNVFVASNGFEAPDPTEFTHINWVTVAWLLVVAVLIGRFVFLCLQTRRLVNEATPLKTLRELPRYPDLVDAAGLRRAPKLLVSDGLPSPTLVGGFYPAVLLPFEVVETASDEDLEMMVAHELAHLARKDLWWQGLEGLVQTVFFFHPLLWLARQRSHLATESATDALAIRIAGAPPRRYAEMLVRVTLHTQNPVRPPAPVLALFGSSRTLYQRIDAMQTLNTKPTLARVAATILAVAGAVTLLPAYRLQTPELASDKTKGLSDLKQVAIATLMYVNDWDDIYPVFKDPQKLHDAIHPYLKNREIWNTHNPKGTTFNYALNLANVNMTSIPEPSNAPMYFESGTWQDGSRLVAFTDGHVKIIHPDRWADVEKRLKTKYPKGTVKKTKGVGH